MHDPTSELAVLRERVGRLEREVSELRAQAVPPEEYRALLRSVGRLEGELGAVRQVVLAPPPRLLPARAPAPAPEKIPTAPTAPPAHA